MIITGFESNFRWNCKVYLNVVRRSINYRVCSKSLKTANTGRETVTCGTCEGKSKWLRSLPAGVGTCESRTLLAWETQTNKDWFIAISSCSWTINWEKIVLNLWLFSRRSIFAQEAKVLFRREGKPRFYEVDMKWVKAASLKFSQRWYN